MILTTKELCEKFKVSRETIRLWRNYQGMPYMQYGAKTFRYDVQAIEEWANKKFKK